MRILFLSAMNAGRGQMAEALAKSILGPKAIVESAGLDPAKKVDPCAVEVMREIGLDISRAKPKIWDELPGVFFDTLDVLVTLCSETAKMDLSSQAQRLDWTLADPAKAGGFEQKMAAFRQARDELKTRLEKLRAARGH